LFDDDSACKALLQWAGLHDAGDFDYHAKREADIDRLADTCAEHLDWVELNKWLMPN
jgi:adenosylcobyric acid synthase